MSHPRDPVRIQSTRISPRPSRSNLSHNASTSPPPVDRQSGGSSSLPLQVPHSPRSGSRSRASTPSSAASRRRSSASEAKENIPFGPSESGGGMSISAAGDVKGGKVGANGVAQHAKSPGKKYTTSNGLSGRDGSVDPEDAPAGAELRKRLPRRTKSPSPSTSLSASDPNTTHPKAVGKDYYNGLPTLPVIADNDDPDCAIDDSPSGPSSPSSPASERDIRIRPPPPAPSAATGTGERAVTRQRRSSSIKRKLSPGVRPVKAVDWEIPRKTLHSSIGFLTILLNHLDPPSTTPLLVFLLFGLAAVTIADYLRFTFPAFAEFWEFYLGFLMRESERNKINGVVWYLVGVCFVLGLYPRDVAVVSILILSWSDTTASTIGRLWGRHTPPLPPNFPGIKAIKFAPRKSLAGFLAATITTAGICLGFWAKGSNGRWAVLDGRSWVGLVGTAGVVGLGGAVVEALDLGLDDNLTLPILSGAIIWAWLGATNLILS